MMMMNEPVEPTQHTYAPADDGAPPVQQHWQQRDKDHEHIKLLAIFWHVSAALNLLGGCFGLLYVGLGVMFMNAPPPQNPNEPPPEVIGWIMIAVGGGVLALTALIGALDVAVGLSLPKYKRYTLCMVVAALMCLSVPLGSKIWR